MLIPYLKRLDGALVPQYCATSDSIISNECPSSEWQSLATFEMIFNNSNPWAGEQLYPRTCSPRVTQLTGRNSIRQSLTGVWTDTTQGTQGAHQEVVVSTTQQSVIADALTNTATLWDIGLINATSGATHGSPFSDQRAATHTIKHSYYQPYAAGTCSGKMYLNMTEGSPIRFPLPLGQLGLTGNTTIPIDDDNNYLSNGTEYYGISPTQILDTSKSSHLDYRLRWVQFPKDLFNSSTLGAIVLLPRETEDSSQLIHTCIISAGWGTSSLSTSTGPWVEPVLSQAYTPAIVQQHHNFEDFSQNHQSFFQQTEGQAGFFAEPYYPERPIDITSDWADYLDPFISSINTTAFNALMSLHGLEILPHNMRASYMLVGLMTNGLARVGFKNRLQGSLKTFTNPMSNDTELDGKFWLSGKGDVFSVEPVESKDWVKFFVESSIQGYTYNTSGAAPKVAITFLLAYCAFALSHVLYAGFSGMTLLLHASASQRLGLPSLSTSLTSSQESVPPLGIPSPKSPL